MKSGKWMTLSVVFLLGCAVIFGGCGVVDEIVEEFLPNEGQFNGVWKSSGNPDIVISGFDFKDAGYTATANVTIGSHNLGSLRFETDDGAYYVYNGGSDRYVSVNMSSSYSTCWVTATLSAQGIYIRNAEYVKQSSSTLPVNPPIPDDPNDNPIIDPTLPLTIMPASLTMNVGDIQSLLVYNVKGTLTWMSQNESVAVNPDGPTAARVVAIAPGETDVIAFDSNGAQALCRVTVTSGTTPTSRGIR
jgi:hypothetical protein